MVEFREITSVHNPRIKTVLRLRERRGRRQAGRLVIDGPRELQLALEAQVAIEEVYVHGALAPADAHLVAALQGAGALCFRVSAEVAAKLGYGQREARVLAVAQSPPRSLEQLPCGPQPLVAVLESVEKPGNLGAVLRTADAAGVDALLATGSGADFDNPNAIRASLGAVFTVPAVATTTAEALRWIRSRGLAIFAARVDAQLCYTEIDLRRGAAIALGSEAEGLSAQWHAADVTPIKLPMAGRVDSLNVSVAAAVLMYEARRQRGERGPRP